MDLNYKTTAKFIESDFIIVERVQDKLLRKKPKIIYIVGGAGFGKTSLLKILYAKSVKKKNNFEAKQEEVLIYILIIIR